jgi:hypothetical protein
MKIEQGKKYVTRDGRVIGPMVVITDIRIAKCEVTGICLFIENGCGRRDGWNTKNDAVAEWREPLKIEAGKRYITKGGVVVGPMEAERTYFIEAEPNVKSITFAPCRESWRIDGTVCMGQKADWANEIVSEYVDAPLKLKNGAYYQTLSGLIVGPMKGNDKDRWRSENPLVMQACCPDTPQIWNGDGSIFAMCKGEELHWLVTEVKAPESAPRGACTENERLKAVITGMKGKLDRVQNIHAHTVKSLRKARADVKKANKALSEQQRVNSSLEARLAEVVKAIADTAEYVGGIERTAPKVKVAARKVDVGDTEVGDINSLKALAAGFGNKCLASGFVWGSTPQGHDYWNIRRHGLSPITPNDIQFFKALLEKHRK